MAWTTPATWTVGQLVTASDLNTQVRDNLDFLKNPPFHLSVLNQSADYSYNGTVFADVDGTALARTITTAGGTVLIGGVFNVARGGSPSRVFFDVLIDGTLSLGGDDGIVGAEDPENAAPGGAITLLAWGTGLSAGAHTFKLRWKTSGVTMTFYAGAGTTGGDVHNQFWVREIS